MSVTFLTPFLVWPQTYLSRRWRKAAEFSFSVLVFTYRLPALCCPLVVLPLWLIKVQSVPLRRIVFGRICSSVTTSPPLVWFSFSTTNSFLLGNLRKNRSQKKKKKKGEIKNTNLIGCPSDQVKDWALATRSGREGERRRGGGRKGREVGRSRKQGRKKEKLPLSVKCVGEVSTLMHFYKTVWVSAGLRTPQVC